MFVLSVLDMQRAAKETHIFQSVIYLRVIDSFRGTETQQTSASASGNFDIYSQAPKETEAADMYRRSLDFEYFRIVKNSKAPRMVGDIQILEDFIHLQKKNADTGRKTGHFRYFWTVKKYRHAPNMAALPVTFDILTREKEATDIAFLVPVFGHTEGAEREDAADIDCFTVIFLGREDIKKPARTCTSNIYATGGRYNKLTRR